jgi:hypothetical protein
MSKAQGDGEIHPMYVSVARQLHACFFSQEKSELLSKESLT